MLEDLKERVFKANLKLVDLGLVILTWGNVSEISDDRKFVAIKPSGVDYSIMKADDMVIVDLDGNVIEGDLRPSSDLATHLEIYRNFTDVKAVVHTHSRFATARAQAEKDLPCYGTTHADTFYGSVPCTRHLSDAEITDAYELNTGKVIIETFKERNIDPQAVPGVLVRKHGPFTWGKNADDAVKTALILEECAHMAAVTELNDPQVRPAPQYLMDKHYFRKHGKNAYYGQPGR